MLQNNQKLVAKSKTQSGKQDFILLKFEKQIVEKKGPEYPTTSKH